MMQDTEALNCWVEFAMKAIPDRKDPIAVTMVEAQWLFWPGERGGGWRGRGQSFTPYTRGSIKPLKGKLLSDVSALL